MVPPRAEAARPVEAVTKVESLGKACRMCFSSSDLPVPAHPVKKTLLPLLQTPTTRRRCHCYYCYAKKTRDYVAGNDTVTLRDTVITP